MVKEHRYEELEHVVLSINRPSIFLAGPTVRGHQPHLISWRFEAVEEFKRQGFEGDLIIPEFTSKTESDKSKLWIPMWEYNGLKKADCIMFWIPRTIELIALTTNMEFGYWQGREPDKIIYGRPDDAYRMSYLDIMWSETAREKGEVAGIYNTLEYTVKASIELANARFNEIVIDNEPDVDETPINELIYKALEKLDIMRDYQVSGYLNGNGMSGLTVCPKCYVDDFTHVAGCDFQ